MKKILFLVLIIIVLSGCIQDQKPAQTSISTPEDWQKSDTGFGTSLNPKDNKQVNINIESIDWENDLNNAIVFATSIYKDLGDYQEISRKDVSLFGSSGKEIIIRYTESGSEISNAFEGTNLTNYKKTKLLLSVQNKKAKIISYSAPEKDFDKYLNQLDEVIKTS